MDYVTVKDYIRQNGVIPKKVKTVLGIATKIYEKIPRKTDSTLQVVLKLMSIADSIESSVQTKKTELSALIERMGLESTTNTVFAQMFFGTKLQEEFELRQYFLDGTHIVEAFNEKYGRLLFTERWEKQYSPTFYHSKGFDFEKILQLTWDLYDGRLQFELHWNQSSFTTFSTIPNPLYGQDAQRMEKMVRRHKQYVADGKSRAYMFHGAPGTGKTSFALAFAGRLGNRVLRVDARSFSLITVSEISFIIDALKPDFIIVDDVDKADVNSSLPTILNIISELKQHKSTTSLLLTANVVTGFDHGLLRPGRIDTWITFNTPDATERMHIILGYLKEAGVKAAPEVIRNFIRITDGMTQDYLREIADRLKYESAEDVTTLIMSMRKLLGKPDLDKEAEKKEPEKAHVNGVNGKAVTAAS